MCKMMWKCIPASGARKERAGAKLNLCEMWHMQDMSKSERLSGLIGVKISDILDQGHKDNTSRLRPSCGQCKHGQQAMQFTNELCHRIEFVLMYDNADSMDVGYLKLAEAPKTGNGPVVWDSTIADMSFMVENKDKFARLWEN